MALTSQTVLDVVNSTQTISFYEGATLTDQITYSSNAITFSLNTGFSLSKQDCLLYFQYLNAFNKALIINFPVVQGAVRGIFPVSQFSISETNAKGVNIVYTQSSQGIPVYSTTYNANNTTVSYSARHSITISLQEWFMCVLMMYQYTNQISLN